MIIGEIYYSYEPAVVVTCRHLSVFLETESSVSHKISQLVLGS